MIIVIIINTTALNHLPETEKKLFCPLNYYLHSFSCYISRSVHAYSVKYKKFSHHHRWLRNEHDIFTYYRLPIICRILGADILYRPIINTITFNCSITLFASNTTYSLTSSSFSTQNENKRGSLGWQIFYTAILFFLFFFIFSIHSLNLVYFWLDKYFNQ